MVRKLMPLVWCGFILLLVSHSGCADADSVELYPAEGTITFNGSPLVNASVIFQPESGPVAFGTTDMKGHYVLATGGAPGIVAGSAKVAVNVAQPASAEADDAEVERYMKTGELPERLVNPPKSPIPERFSKPDSSGLTANVTDDPGKNTFDFDLKP